MSKISENVSQEEQELFESFLLDQMDTVEKDLFRKKLSENLKLSENFELFKALFSAVEEDGLRSKFEDFHSEIKNEKTNTLSILYFRKYQYIIAASIALLIIIGGAYLFTNDNTSNTALYKKYYAVDPGLPTVMGKSDDYEFYKAMVDYKQEKYEAAIKAWENLLPNKTDNDTLNYFLGAAYLATENESKAISFFERVSTNKQSFFYNDTQFYLGLIALKNGQIPKAKTYFELSKTDKSDKILKQLKNK